MTRNPAPVRVIDLGKASRETKGGLIGGHDTVGLQAPFGLSND